MIFLWMASMIVSFYLGVGHGRNKLRNAQIGVHDSIRKLAKLDPSIINKIDKDWQQYENALLYVSQSLQNLENNLKEIKADYDH